MKQIYFPVSCSILTVGHIKCLEYLTCQGDVIIGLLTDNALKGYKKSIVPFEDRKYILETIVMAVGNSSVVSQETLDPTDNILAYGCDSIASGDGWEEKELKAIEELKIERIDVQLKNEKKGEKKYSSSSIIKKLND